jgi:hypothetical protein
VCVLGDRSVPWTCVRRQACAAGVCKETGLCGVCVGRQVCALDVWEKTGLCKETGLCSWCVEGDGGIAPYILNCSCR